MYNKIRTLSALLITACGLVLTAHANAASKVELDAKAQAVLEKLYSEQPAAKVLANKANGILVFPRIIKGGVGIGGEVGEGALIRSGQGNIYYRVAALSVGFQLGGQAKSEVIMFMTPGSLEKFINSKGWEAGVDGSVAVIEFGVGKEIDTNSIKDEIIAFVFDNKGLMYNLSLEGSKFWKINKN